MELHNPHKKFPIGLPHDLEVTEAKADEYVATYKKVKESLLFGELAEVEELFFFGIEKEIAYQERPSFVIPWYNPNTFYPVTLISVQIHKYITLPYFFIKTERISWMDLRKKTLKVGFYFEKNKKFVFKSFIFDNILSEEWLKSKSRFYGAMGYKEDVDLEKGASHSLRDYELAKKYSSAIITNRSHDVSIAYWKRMERELRHFLHSRFSNEIVATQISEEISRAGEDINGHGFDTPQATHEFFKALWNENPAKWFQQSIISINKISEQSLTNLSQSLLWHQRLFIWLTEQMREGKSVPSLYLDKGYSVGFDPLDLEALKGKYGEFWEEVPIELAFYNDKTVGAANLHISKQQFLANCPHYEGDISEGLEFVKSQLMEAVSLKEWTLPFGGYFQLVGAVCGLKTFEINDDVFCLFCFKNGRYLRMVLNPALQTYILPPDPEAVFFEGSDGVYATNGKIEWLTDRAILGLLLIASATIRDGWVVEERETVFGEGRAIRKTSPLLGDYRKPIIVYLPRIKYVKKAEDVERAKADLNYAVRCQHWVKGHLRKAVKASPAQILLAQRHGVYIPEGKTYVQGHNRGQQAAERIYRSRSALKCLRALEGVGLGVDGWFSFEKNVKQWLESLGYKADHKAASRNGDGGIDIQASKGSEHLYVQCKYWKDPVGISVVREMIGTLITYPEGSCGVIVTSSELTIPAKELAIDYGIQFVENVSFEKSIDHKLKKRIKEN